MTADPAFTVALAQWARDQQILSQIRFTVFVREQGVPPELEIDDADADEASVVHVVALDGSGNAVGTGRMLINGRVPRIGRMAVLKAWRGSGVGAAILKFLCEEARRRGYTQATLHSQTHATPFYYKQGFISHGDEFTEAGIPHLEMRRAL